MTERSHRTGILLLPAGRADGVRFGLQGHAEFGSESGDGSRWEVKVKSLQQGGEKEEHLHAGQLLPEALTSPCEQKHRHLGWELERIPKSSHVSLNAHGVVGVRREVLDEEITMYIIRCSDKETLLGEKATRHRKDARDHSKGKQIQCSLNDMNVYDEKPIKKFRISI